LFFFLGSGKYTGAVYRVVFWTYVFKLLQCFCLISSSQLRQ